MCGTASPTNAIGPAAATAPPASSTKPDARERARARRRAGRARGRRRRRARARSAERPAPSAIAEPGGDERQRRRARRRRRGPAIEPTIQKRNSSSVCASKTSTALVSEMSSAASTAPASASRTGVGPPRPERAERRTRARRSTPGAEQRERRCRPVTEATPRNVIASTTANAAPALMPEDARLGERVARHALHQRPGRAERRADEQPELRARHPQVAHDRVGVAAVVGGERPEHLAERDRARADGERGEHAEREQRRAGQQPASRPRGSAGGRAARSSHAAGGWS